MLLWLGVLGCVDAEPEGPTGPDYLGLWSVENYTRGCEFPETSDFEASHVMIEQVSDLGELSINVYACSSSTDCDPFFSVYSMDVQDDRSAAREVEGFGIFEGSCDFTWSRTSLEMEGEAVTIRVDTEGNAESVSAEDVAACGALMSSYSGAKECLRREELVLLSTAEPSP